MVVCNRCGYRCHVDYRDEVCESCGAGRLTEFREPAKPSDPVNKPAHYTHGSIQPIDVIEDWNLGFNLGNALKYIARCDHKGNPSEDLGKAIWYLNREVVRRGKESKGE